MEVVNIRAPPPPINAGEAEAAEGEDVEEDDDDPGLWAYTCFHLDLDGKLDRSKKNVRTLP